jgi:formylglycine-generating enzyme required for sulfatase activity
MSSLADLPDLVGFFSYSRRDDEHSLGALSRLRARIQSELRLQMGRDFRLWQDTAAIPEGALWENEIKRAISESVFFIPIVTPSAVGSAQCRFEFEAFLQRESELGRNDLIFPILYITVEGLENEKQWRQNALLTIIASRQYLDWRKHRHHDHSSPDLAQNIEQFSGNIYRALRQPWVAPEERRREVDADAGRRIEEQQRRRRTPKKGEERRRQETDAKLEEEKALAAVKHADSVSAIDKFLLDYSASQVAEDARAHRANLLTREQEFRDVMASDDPSALKAFIDKHPKDPLATQARDRLGSLQPRRAFRPSLPFLLTGVALVIGAGIIWLATGLPSLQPSLSHDAPLSPEQEAALKPRDGFKECATCPQMLVVPAGNFTMGSPDDEPGRNPDENEVPVTIAQPFAVGKHAVTFDEWDACTAGGGCNADVPNDAGWGRGLRPVINVSWKDAKAYTAWLSHKTEKTYRLLSEAEREYVTRAGTTTPFWWGSSITPKQANYNSSYLYQGGGSKGAYAAQTVPVESFAPNPWGLYQVHGNVWEWTEDCWNDNNRGSLDNPAARTPSADCDRHVVRGGSWYDSPVFLRSASRGNYPSDSRSDSIGFRVARILTH